MDGSHLTKRDETDTGIGVRSRVSLSHERGSLLITTNLPFSEWGQIFQGERMTAALLDRLTHRCHIFEMNGESYRFRESMKAKRTSNTKQV